jgi:hypothetical protein
MATLRPKSLGNISTLKLPYSQYELTHSLGQRCMTWGVQGGIRWLQVVRPAGRPPLKWPYGYFKGPGGPPIGPRKALVLGIL